MGQVIRTDSGEFETTQVVLQLQENNAKIEETQVLMQQQLTQLRILNIYKSNENDFVIDDSIFNTNETD